MLEIILNLPFVFFHYVVRMGRNSLDRHGGDSDVSCSQLVLC